MEKIQRLREAVRRHAVPDITAERLAADSITTPDYAFRAFRIGNSVGDTFDIAMAYLLAEAIAHKCNVILYTVEHCELHSKGDSSQALDDLIEAALMFDSLQLDAAYRSLLRELQAEDLRRIRSLVEARSK